MKKWNDILKEDEIQDNFTQDLSKVSINDLKVEDVIVQVERFHKEKISNSLQKYFLGEFGGVKFYTVNGNYININYDMGFVGGSNYMVVDYIPKGESWIDNEIPNLEFRYYIIHEWKEIREMEENGLGYDNVKNPELDLDYAHPRASEWERTYRKIRNF